MRCGPWFDLRPKAPRDGSLEQYCEDLLGATLYQVFVRSYTEKHWGCEARDLAAEWAPKRIELRNDGVLDAFRDEYQGWPVGGYNPLIYALLAGSGVHTGTRVTGMTHEWRSFDAHVVTAPLDEFLNLEYGRLSWRGTRFAHESMPHVEGRCLAAGAVNYPTPAVAFTRRSEAKWSTGLRHQGTVVTTEYPGESSDRHYPVADTHGANRELNNRYRQLLQSKFGPAVHVVGRLGTYTYINMDQAIRQGVNAARRIVGEKAFPALSRISEVERGDVSEKAI